MVVHWTICCLQISVYFERWCDFMNSYSMQETMDVAKTSSSELEHFLRKQKGTIDVVNVEDDKYFQEKDIDLLWIKDRNGEKVVRKIEIKGDRYHYTGNYFIETISNVNSCSPGCFLYSEADYLFYYFVFIKELHILPMERIRKWFLANQHRFELKKLSTKINQKVVYKSYGKVVPKSIVLEEVKGVKVISL